MSLDSQMVASVASLLGREPRGLEAVPVLAECGGPAVIRVASLVDGKPFPTLFWLVDPGLNYRIDQLEAVGTIKLFQQRIDADPALRASMERDHLAHIALRQQYMSPEVRQMVCELGFEQALAEKGIGGIAERHRVRCLHTWYAAHLVVPNTVGGLLDEWWAQNPPD